MAVSLRQPSISLVVTVTGFQNLAGDGPPPPGVILTGIRYRELVRQHGERLSDRPIFKAVLGIFRAWGANKKQESKTPPKMKSVKTIGLHFFGQK